MEKQREQLIQSIQKKGIVGAGGAGFPTHVKLDCSCEIVIANGAECEPLLHKDKELLTAYTKTIMEGLNVVMKITGAKQGIVAVKKKAIQAIEKLEPFMKTPYSIHLLDDVYPAGDEFITTYEVTGRIPPAGGLPLHVGVIVQNVETLLWIGSAAPVTQKTFTIAGDLSEPVTVRAPIGISLSDVLQDVGVKNIENHGYVLGGVMMGTLGDNLELPVTKTLGGIIVLPEGHSLLKRYQRSRDVGKRIGSSACDQCSFCTQICPRYLLGHPVYPHIAMRYNAMALPDTPPPEASKFCCGCQLCSMWSCPEDLDPGWITFDYRKEVLAKSSNELIWIDSVHPMYEYRKPPISALKRRLGLDDFEDQGPLKTAPMTPDKVNIPLLQNVGKPSVPIVKVGDHVTKDQILAQPPENALGTFVHASIDGIVQSVENQITIERDKS